MSARGERGFASRGGRGFASRGERGFASREERGFALLIVLWTLVLISLLLTQVTAAGSGEARLASNLRQAAALQEIADGGVHDALFRLIDSTAATHWTADGSTRRLLVQGVPVDLRLSDLGGRINPNIAPADLLAALMRAVGAEQRDAETISLAILDWRSPGQRSRLSEGSKSAPYAAAGRSLGPPGRKFQSLDDLGLVLGMTPPLLALLRPHMTLYTTSDPQVALADPVVRRAFTLVADAADASSNELPDAQVVAIDATSSAAGATARRHAVAVVSAGGTGRPWHIVAWDDAS